MNLRPTPSPTPDLAAGIDRSDLSHDRRVWLIYGLMFAIVGLSSLLIPVLWPSVYDEARLWPFAAVLLVISVAALASRPPTLGTWQNHIALGLVMAIASLGVVAYQPAGVAPVAAAIFAGTFIAGRLKNRRHLVKHYVAGSLFLLAPVFLVELDLTTKLAILTMIPSVWVLGLCSVLILEAAEAQSRELASLVRLDPLTGVGNRRLLTETLEAELPRHAEDGRTLTVLALDLNGFKALNDELGHDAGDALLQAVATALVSAVGEGDTVVRQGGDEFCVVLPRTTPEQVAGTRAAIQRALVRLSGGGPPVSSGIGKATYPDDGYTADELLEVADTRLAAHKRTVRAVPRLMAHPPSVAAATPVEPKLPPVGSVRVSRRELAVNLPVWRGMGVMLGLHALLLASIAVVVDGSDRWFAAGLSAALVLMTIVALRREPPRMRSVFNHVVVAVPYVVPLVCIVALPAYAGAVVGALSLAGPLIAARLERRREIVAHYLVATAGMLAVILSGVVPVPMVIALGLLVLVTWAGGAGAGIYLERAEHQGDELERLVRRDPLTGAGNRRLLSEELARELRRHARMRRALSVLALDLNGFKALNDELGHGAGDELLKQVATTLSEVVRDYDTVVRQGGDEFCVLLPETDAAHAVPVANAVRAAIAGLGTPEHPITTGVGVATYPTEATTGDVLLYVADERLRLDKEASGSRPRTPKSRPAPTELELVDRRFAAGDRRDQG